MRTGATAISTRTNIKELMINPDVTREDILEEVKEFTDTLL